MFFIVPLRTEGLVFADLGARLYLNSAAPYDPPSAVTIAPSVTMTDLGGGNYLVDGLPEGATSRCYSLTYEFGGVWYSKVWGGWADNGGAPTIVVLPVRTGGLDVSDLAPTLYRSGEVEAVTFTAVELGAPGDYAVHGWPVQTEGAPCLLTWEPGGEISWTEAEAPVASSSALAYDDKRRETAAKLAAKGGPVTLRRPVITYDPATQTGTEEDPEDFPLHAVVMDYDARQIDGTNILPADRKGLVSVSDALQAQITAGVRPDSTWRMLADGMVYGVEAVAPLQPAPGGAWIFMEIQMRRGE